MTSHKDIVRDLIKYSDHVKKIARPLKDHFGISYFYHYSIDSTGKFSFFSSHPEIEEFYFSDKIYLNDPYTRHPSNYHSGLLLLEANGPDEWRDSVNTTTGAFNFVPWVSYIEKNVNSFEFFGFWKDREPNRSLAKFQLNHSQLLNKFIEHFKKEMTPSFLKARESTYYIQDLVGKEHFYANLPVDLTIKQSSLRAYLIDVGLRSEVLKADSLSTREKQCLRLLIQGNSAKDIAFRLHLSPRTIEKYLDTSKTKLSCWNKQELFSATQSLEELGLI